MWARGGSHVESSLARRGVGGNRRSGNRKSGEVSVAFEFAALALLSEAMRLHTGRAFDALVAIRDYEQQTAD